MMQSPTSFLSLIEEDLRRESMSLDEHKQQRVDVLLDVLSNPTSAVNQVRCLSFKGIPDVPTLRAILWKILLNYFPMNPDCWSTTMEENFARYDKLRKELLPRNQETSSNCDADRKLEKLKVPVNDHPLAFGAQGKWSGYFIDQELMGAIKNDVKRTRQEVSLFKEYTRSSVENYNNEVNDLRISHPDLTEEEKWNSMLATVAKMPEVTSVRKRSMVKLEIQSELDTHRDVMARILFIYAKEHPKVKYIQGMSDLLAPLYYTFIQDEQIRFQPFAESDCYACFCNLMEEVSDNFLLKLNESTTSYTSANGRRKSAVRDTIENDQVKEIVRTLKRIDFKLWLHLEQQSAKFELYGLKWIMCLLAQEFTLESVQRLWDSMLSDPDRFVYLNYLCVTIIELKREEILAGGFAEVMMNLQKPVDVSIEQLINRANQILSSDDNTSWLTRNK